MVFFVLRGKVILFGVMEDIFENSGFLLKFKIFFEKVEIVLFEGGEFDKVCNEL